VGEGTVVTIVLPGRVGAPREEGLGVRD